MANKLTVVAFGAHPDDIEADMMGTLLKYQDQGHAVYMAIVTDGRRGGSGDIAAVRRKEALAAVAHLRIEPIFLDFEDGRLVHSRETYEKIVAVCERIRPDVVFTHDPDDYHADHRALSRLVTDAAWAPVFYADTMAGVGFVPTFYVDITPEFERKKRILAEHVSQKGCRIMEIMEVLCRFRGLQMNWMETAYAEAFRLFPRCDYLAAYRLLPG